MATNVTLNDDLKDYLSKSNGKSASSSLKENISEFFGGNTSRSSWFYQRVNTNDDVESNETPNGSTGSWFSSLSLSSSQPQSNSWLPSLSRTQRIIGFILFVGMGIFCFVLASFYIPILIIKPRKFALLFTLGSVFIVSSFSILWGPMSHIKHLFSRERLPFTLTYFGSLLTTLYFALTMQTLLTIIFAVIQIVALIWYVISYLPGGPTGLSFLSKVVTRSLPV